MSVIVEEQEGRDAPTLDILKQINNQLLSNKNQMNKVLSNQDQMKETLKKHEGRITQHSELIKNELSLITANWSNWLIKQAPATKARPSDQGNSETCTSHAIAKGLQDFLDTKKIEEDCQEQIINSLVRISGAQRQFVSFFSGKNIEVHTKETGPLSVMLHVTTAFNNTLPFASLDQYDQLKKNDDSSCVILRWRIPEDRYGDDRDGDVHALYATSYQVDKMIFDCINSWGEGGGNEPFLQVPDSQVERVYRVRFEIKA